MASPNEITISLVTYGLLAPANMEKLESWFEDLFTELQSGTGGGELLSSTVAGRSMTFAPSGMTTQGMFNSLGQAIQILNGRCKTRGVMRF